ncbi:MAG: putative acetyltransferases and hydrolases with the alpha/beta hydrolase fold [Candidatus Ozemobacter sibiricus]|jgi:hypothetical protein|uniref:Putative acetyltransferases and hydrolases with the alpha/beta hydrolase fold n=1 Tax=Candidatus Ozemobacter sibiricus TaxID=2268124 RepID=A0A367ZKL5_9BACT|nr:MAG: putative acetyltransferases and hydrolases with the alpha/beta hydrolase fold [Candidatus Ozemobacter sibiricus]
MSVRLVCPPRARRHLFLLWVIVLATASALLASDRFNPIPRQVFTGPEAGPWERVELLEDTHPAFTQETFAPPTRWQDPWIRRWFGTDTPSSGLVLLHCAKGYQGRTFRHPVLLVHGAGDNANRAWIHPFHAVLPDDPLPPEKQGFAPWLANLGYAVFAVTFAHNQGDNFRQAEQVANAIRRIRILLGRTHDPTFAVDVVAHSKGNVAVRLYCSDGAALFPQKRFLTPFRGDVRTYIAIAPPMRGIDTPFRSYAYNLAVATKGTYNAPVAPDAMLLNGQWQSMDARSLFPDKGGNPFPGQCQLLYNLVRDAGVRLGADSATPFDHNLTRDALYHGGRSTVLHGRGIDAAIAAGEHLIYRLEAQGLDPRVRLAVLAGTKRYITWYVDGLGYIPLPAELAAPAGDGVVFLASACHLDGILRRHAPLLGMKTLDLNHLGLTCHRDAFAAIDEWLIAP